MFGIHRCVYIGIVFVRQSHNDPEGSAAAADTICIGQLILAQRKTSWTMTVIKTDSDGDRRPQMFAIFVVCLRQTLPL